MADTTEVLHVDGKTFDTDDLTYGERREIKRIVRLELWDEEVDGEWTDWDDAPTDDYMTATREDVGGETRLTFEHGVFESAEQCASHRQGWSSFLDHLGDYLAAL